MGVPHGFSTRGGGVSQPPFESLNLGLCVAFAERGAAPQDVQDEAARIEENTRRFLVACGLSGRRPVRVRQVHGRAVAVAEHVVDSAVEADAVIATAPSDAAIVRTADCVPVLIASIDGQGATHAVAAVHAGWRGLVQGVIEAAIQALVDEGGEPLRMVASIGPSIGVDAYEVGEDVAGQFRARGLAAAVREGRAKPHLDCHRAARMLLERVGVPADRIDGEPLCTFAHAAEFFSARRDGAVGGRLAAAIGLPSR